MYLPALRSIYRFFCALSHISLPKMADDMGSDDNYLELYTLPSWR
jgi:hypothetical protein